jgi:hypothetical protein
MRMNAIDVILKIIEIDENMLQTPAEVNLYTYVILLSRPNI